MEMEKGVGVNAKISQIFKSGKKENQLKLKLMDQRDSKNSHNHVNNLIKSKDWKKIDKIQRKFSKNIKVREITQEYKPKFFTGKYTLLYNRRK